MRPIEFKGTASSYFGIWISNSVLSIVTLGIYSAWAKVRRKQFFLNHTEIDGYPLAYHAKGLQLLLGRMITFGVIIAYSTASTITPAASIILLPVLMFGLAWVLNRSLRFNATMTSWRNIRFNWHGTYWKTLLYFVIGPFVGIASAGILVPLFSRYYYQYYADHFSFGTTSFSAATKIRRFYGAFGLLLLTTGGLLLFTFLVIVIIISLSLGGISDDFAEWAVIFFVLIFVVVVSFIYAVMCRNILIRTLKLGDAVSFSSTLSPIRLCWITISNFLAIIFSLGILYPWTVVRLYRYLAQNTLYEIHTDVDQFIEQEHEKIGSFGEEFVDIEGFDVSI